MLKADSDGERKKQDTVRKPSRKREIFDYRLLAHKCAYSQKHAHMQYTHMNTP